MPSQTALSEHRIPQNADSKVSNSNRGSGIFGVKSQQRDQDIALSSPLLNGGNNHVAMENLHNTEPNMSGPVNGDEDGEEVIVTSIREAPITDMRKPYIPRGSEVKLRNPGTARANTAPTPQKPHGTMHKDWARKHADQTVLQQHCDFFDTDRDGVLWPRDTFTGFRKLGFNLVFSVIAVLVIHGNFSYPTSPSLLPDPCFRIRISQIHRTKHGSDTGAYDNEGRFVPQKFEEIFTKYASGRDYVTVWDVRDMMVGQRNVGDVIGWGGFVFEWLATYVMLWPEDGRMMKEDIRGVFDGSIFFRIAERRGEDVSYEL